MDRNHRIIKVAAAILSVLLMTIAVYSMFISSAYAEHEHEDGNESSCLICFELRFAESLKKHLMPAGSPEILPAVLTVFAGMLYLYPDCYVSGRNLITDKVRMDR